MSTAHRSTPGTNRRTTILLSTGAAALLISGATFIGSSPAQAQADPFGLGTAESFGVLGDSTVTNTGPTVVTGGSVGVNPGTAITGFPPGIVGPPGTIQTGSSAAQAQNDATTSYNMVSGMPAGAVLTGQDLGGMTLTPGVYDFSTSAQLTGDLVLDAGGDPDAEFVFKIGSTLTTASGSSVVLLNGASSCGVYWQIGSSATLGTGTSMVGTLAALVSGTLNTNANLTGRVIALTGAVTLDSNNITVPLCDSPVVPGDDDEPPVVPGDDDEPPVVPGDDDEPPVVPGDDDATTGTGDGTPNGGDAVTSGTGDGTPNGGDAAATGTGDASVVTGVGVIEGGTPIGSDRGDRVDTTPVVPAGHPETGLGGTQPTNRQAGSSETFTLAGLALLGAAASARIAARERVQASNNH